MLRTLSCLLCLALASQLPCRAADTTDAKDLTVTKSIWTAPARQQGRSNTCWAFATVALLESEVHRLGRGDIALSEIWFARQAYPLKALAYLRSHGENRLADGGLAHDVLEILRQQGCVPAAAYPGRPPASQGHDHFEMHAAVEGYLHALAKFGNSEPLSGAWNSGTLHAAWLDGLAGILDAYLGAPPAAFQYEGKSYTPRSFADSALGLNPDDYVEIASSSRWPFHTRGDLMLPDNWLHRTMHNLPIDEFQQVVDHALETGFTVAVSIDKRRTESTSSSPVLRALDEETTKAFTQDLRDSLLESWRTDDIHLIQLHGLATDKAGHRYYLAKDSLSPADEPGAQYFNKNYLTVAALRTRVNFLLVHKDALPAEIRRRLGL